MGKIAIIIFISSILSKIIGFLREVLIGKFYGATAITDAFFISLTIPWTLFGVISTGILSAYLPVYSTMYNIDKKKSEAFTSNLLTIVTIIIVPIFYIFIYLFSKDLIGLFGKNLNEQEINIAVQFLRISSLVLFFTGILAIWTGKLQFHNLFLAIPLSGIVLNIVIIFFIYASKYYSIYFLPLSIVMGNLFQFMIILIYMKKKKVMNYRFKLKINDENLNDFSKMIVPIMISASSAQIIYFIDQVIASRIITGGVSLINYTQKINEVFLQLFLFTIITLVFPKLSKLSNEPILFNKVLTKTIDIISFLCIPLVVFCVSNGHYIIEMIYGGDAFSIEEKNTMSILLSFYVSSIFLIGYRDILNKALFALKISKITMYLSIIILVINVVLSLQLSKILGIISIPISGLISNLIAIIFLSVYLKRKINFKILSKKSISIFLNSLICSLIAISITKITERTLFNEVNDFFVLFGNFSVFCAIFLFVSYVNKDLIYVKNILK